MDELVTYRILKKDPDTGEVFYGLDEVAYTSKPAVITKGVALTAQTRLSFSDKPKMRIVAPAIIPMEIYRNQDGEEFNVSFSADQIEELHKDLMLKMRETNLFNFEHDKSKNVPAYILEAWIVDNPKLDKAYSTYGIEVPKGTLMLTTQITDEDYYNKIVENDQVGYSIGGLFGMKLSKHEKPNNMNVPDGTHIIAGKAYTFSNGVVTAFEDVEKEEEVALEETPKEEEVAEEVPQEEEVEMAEVAEEVAAEPTAEAITEEQVIAIVDERINEVLNAVAELKAQIEVAKQEDAEQEEKAPVMLTATERLSQFSKSFKNQ